MARVSGAKGLGLRVGVWGFSVLTSVVSQY